MIGSLIDVDIIIIILPLLIMDILYIVFFICLLFSNFKSFISNNGARLFRKKPCHSNKKVLKIKNTLRNFVLDLFLYLYDPNL